MRLTDRLRHRVIRWDSLALALALVLPLGASSVLGALWLYERGWFLYFALGSVGFYALVRLVLAAMRWRSGADAVSTADLQGPLPDPDWSDTETAAYERARARIDTRLTAPIAWTDLPAEALVVVEEIATDLSGGQRSALDFTVPEALLLVDRVALRYRAFLLKNVPYSDKLSVRTMHWLWRKQDAALTAWETGFLAWRGVRLLLNPAVGLLREAERVLATGLQDRLTERFRRDAQAILLEEAAQAAIDLYSGRLRVSDEDLARIAQASEHRDQALAPPADAPLRIAVVGQRGVGKSALVNALLGHDAAGVDDVSLGAGHSAHEGMLAGVPCRFIDTGGFSGEARDLKPVARQMAGSDLVLWVHRANRPGRAADTALTAAFTDILTAEPERRPPPVVHVATGADLLIDGWPRIENEPDTQDRTRLSAAMRAIAETLNAPQVVPVRAEDPSWNIDAVLHSLQAQFPAARHAQRARMAASAAAGAGLRGNAARAGRGTAAAARALWDRRRR